MNGEKARLQYIIKRNQEHLASFSQLILVVAPTDESFPYARVDGLYGHDRLLRVSGLSLMSRSSA